MGKRYTRVRRQKKKGEIIRGHVRKKKKKIPFDWTRFIFVCCMMLGGLYLLINGNGWGIVLIMWAYFKV